MSKPITCVATNVQCGFHRFSASSTRPRLKPYRCELTALSQLYNLYFVACGEAIYVYQPSFPDQTLPQKPALILNPPVSSPNLTYYLDSIHPHSINRLHVDYLGHEEIILVVCDDGDVIGYHVSAIQWEIERRSRDEELTDDDDAGVGKLRGFLHLNVGRSAWGLAVHRNARRIAISANTALITVVSFALTDPSSQDVEPNERLSEGNADALNPCEPNRVLTLVAQSNIPSVAFDNNGSDPSGRWLFSTVIDGKTQLWDLEQPNLPVRTLQLGCCFSTRNYKRAPPASECSCGQVAHGVWGAMFLDPRMSHRHTKIEDALGALPKNTSHSIWDITDAKISRPSRPGLFNPYALQELNEDTDSAGEASDEDVDGDAGEASGGGGDDDHHANEGGDVEETVAVGTDDDHAEGDSDGLSSIANALEAGQDVHLIIENAFAQTVNQVNQAAVVAQAIETDDGAESDDDALFVADTNNPVTEAAQAALVPGVHSLLPSFDQVMQGLDDEDDDGENNAIEDEAVYDVDDIFNQIGNNPRQPRPQKKAYCEVRDIGYSSYGMIPPTVVITKEEIFLLQPFIPNAKRPAPPPEPVIMMRLPLYPRGTFALNYDRQCFFAQIPELGVFLVASPQGRCAIFSVTQLLRPRTKRTSAIYGFKQEHILPTVEQERHGSLGAYQSCQLIGIAVGPVQGMQDTPSGMDQGEGEGANRTESRNRRWRLLMHFRDHTVMSYELSRDGGKTEPGLASLVV